MAKRSSAQIIAGMRERGWSLGQMGRVLGRDSSLLSQVARGVKPGANLQRELAQLASRTSRVKDRAGYAKAHEKALEPARRTVAGGVPAKVRAKPVAVPGENFTVRGLIGKGVTLRNRLKRAARANKLVSFKFRGLFRIYERSGRPQIVDEIDLAEHGWGAGEILAKLNALGFDKDPHEALIQLIYTNPNVDEVIRLDGYTLSTSTRKRGG